MIRASIAGASGYAGGEMLRLLSRHSEVELFQASSRTKAGRYVHSVNPNLRKILSLKFCSPEQLKPCDVLFLCLPHGESMNSIEQYLEIAPNIIDLSADFRLNQSSDYVTWYGQTHSQAQRLDQFVYGIPEIHRNQIADANYVAAAGCNATSVILGVLPIVQEYCVDSIVAEVKVGSSEGGRSFSEGSHHPVRSNAVRSYRPVGHRHVAEMKQELGIEKIYFSATSIGMVRGIVATCHVFLEHENVSEIELWKIYRRRYQKEPFVRIVKDRTGFHRLPEPKHLAGTNFCDVGFVSDPDGERIVVVSALDNLMKGAAGQAVQIMNIMLGVPESAGLEFTGLFPV